MKNMRNSIQILDKHPDDLDYVCKIILVGDSGVGKSCLFFRYTNNIFDDKFSSTIGVDFKAQFIEYNGKNLSPRGYYVTEFSNK